MIDRKCNGYRLCLLILLLFVQCIYVHNIVMSAIPICPKCAINKKSGKSSCCVRGGAWFNKCGEPGDSKFDHTWFEGNRVCKYSHQHPAAAADQTIDSGTDEVNSAGTTIHENCGEIKKIFLFYFLFIIIEHM